MVLRRLIILSCHAFQFEPRPLAEMAYQITSSNTLFSKESVMYWDSISGRQWLSHVHIRSPSFFLIFPLSSLNCSTSSVPLPLPFPFILCHGSWNSEFQVDVFLQALSPPPATDPLIRFLLFPHLSHFSQLLNDSWGRDPNSRWRWNTEHEPWGLEKYDLGIDSWVWEAGRKFERSIIYILWFSSSGSPELSVPLRRVLLEPRLGSCLRSSRRDLSGSRSGTEGFDSMLGSGLEWRQTRSPSSSGVDGDGGGENPACCTSLTPRRKSLSKQYTHCIIVVCTVH